MNIINNQAKTTIAGLGKADQQEINRKNANTRAAVGNATIMNDAFKNQRSTAQTTDEQTKEQDFFNQRNYAIDSRNKIAENANVIKQLQMKQQAGIATNHDLVSLANAQAQQKMAVQNYYLNREKLNLSTQEQLSRRDKAGGYVYSEDGGKTPLPFTPLTGIDEEGGTGEVEYPQGYQTLSAPPVSQSDLQQLPSAPTSVGTPGGGAPQRMGWQQAYQQAIQQSPNDPVKAKAIYHQLTGK